MPPNGIYKRPGKQSTESRQSSNYDVSRLSRDNQTNRTECCKVGDFNRRNRMEFGHHTLVEKYSNGFRNQIPPTTMTTYNENRIIRVDRSLKVLLYRTTGRAQGYSISDSENGSGHNQIAHLANFEHDVGCVSQYQKIELSSTNHPTSPQIETRRQYSSSRKFHPHPESSVNTVGYRFESESVLDKNAEGVFLMDDVVFPRAVIYNISLYCVRPDRSVWIQVWRPVDQKALTYRLVGQVNLITGAVPRYYQIILNTRDEMIFTESGDRLAIYHDKQSSPVAYRFIQSTMTPVYRATPGSDVNMSVGTEISFLDFMFPYRFSVSVTFDTDVDHYLDTGTRTMIVPTVKSTTLRTVPPLPTGRDNLIYMGNLLSSRHSIMTTNARGVYILRHVRFRRGVVVSFFGYFVRKAPIWFQIWRPIRTGDVSMYMLVGQIRAEPDFFPWRQEVSQDRIK
ncbi:hypothetical protein LSH36_292g00084 [Paralvinella palmiformis]|uniref:Uncharacterized protein n=1 Tax=Paralvinella palmiformis TaxID=53620 RepID=A0AAD9JIF8_9ANNE|nr:hypothetical protein LSH36_292g00084 [Paralvinella palmiformis]